MNALLEAFEEVDDEVFEVVVADEGHDRAVDVDDHIAEYGTCMLRSMLSLLYTCPSSVRSLHSVVVALDLSVLK
jgi:hypothetical protein